MEARLEEGVVKPGDEATHVDGQVNLRLPPLGVHVHGQLVQVVHVIPV